jgi:hypothetical protein
MLLGTCVALTTLLLPAGAMAGSPRDLLPDLRMAKPSDIRLQGATEDDPRRLLRFSAVILNVGQGPLIVRGKRDCDTSECPRMRTTQRIKQSDGTTRGVASNGVGKFDVGDGHNHWHVMKFQRYELFQLEPPPEVPGEAIRGAKTGFCFFDTEARRLGLPGAPQQQQFDEPDCGRSNSTSFRMGLSVGWGDLYAWYLPRQWIDTTGIADGRYLLCSTANAERHWQETDTSNNQAWAEIDLEGDTVQVLRMGRSACSTQLPATPPEAGDEGDAGDMVTALEPSARQAAFQVPASAPAGSGLAGAGFLCPIDLDATAGVPRGA